MRRRDTLEEGAKGALQLGQLPPLSARVVGNATQAVLEHAKPPPAATKQQPTPHSPAAGAPASLPASLLPVSHASHAELAASYQRLCAVLLLQLPSRLLHLPEDSLGQHLATYQTSDQAQDDSPQQPNGALGNGASADGAGGRVQAPGPDQGSSGAGEQAGALASVESVEAAELDDDDTPYEDMESPAPPAQPSVPAAPSRPSSAASWQAAAAAAAAPAAACWWEAPAQQQQPPAAAAVPWPEARRRLLHLARREHLQALAVPLLHPLAPAQQAPAAQGATPGAAGTANGSPGGTTQHANGRPSRAMSLGSGSSKRVESGGAGADPPPPQHQQERQQGAGVLLCEQPGSVHALVAAVRSLGVHSRGPGELQALMQGYLELACEWAALHPPGAEGLLRGVWDALGVLSLAALPAQARGCSGGGGGGRARAGAGASSGQNAVLLPEAQLALGMVSQLITKVRSSATEGCTARMRRVRLRCLSSISVCAFRQSACVPFVNQRVCLSSISVCAFRQSACVPFVNQRVCLSSISVCGRAGALDGGADSPPRRWAARAAAAAAGAARRRRRGRRCGAPCTCTCCPWWSAASPTSTSAPPPPPPPLHGRPQSRSSRRRPPLPRPHPTRRSRPRWRSCAR